MEWPVPGLGALSSRNWNSMKTKIARWTAPLLMVLLAACGGGSSDSTTTTTTTDTPALKSLVITPVNPTLAVGTSQQLVATGTYADGKSAAVTTGVTWSAKGSTVLSIFTTGLVTAKAAGIETVTAKVGDISGTTTITVTGPYTAVSAGGSHTVARKADGGLAAWGLNRSGQLGIGSSLEQASPVTAGTSKTWSTVSAGEFHTVALSGCTASGCTLYAWGFNQNGQLGDNTFVDKLTPTKIGTDTTWLAVAAGKAHTLAVKKNGTLWAWGRNFYGQLGDTTLVDRRVPTQVGTGTTWTSVSAGSTHSIGRQADGTVWAWGGNDKSQVAQGAPSTTVVYAVPTVVSSFTFVSIAAGGDHSLVIRGNGSLFAWGANESGQLGDGSTNDGQFPLQVGTDTDWAIISAGASHSVAVKSDGTLWTWGSNAYGQLGDGSTSDGVIPMQIGVETNWVAVSAGKYHTFALKGDGSLWGWGRNQEGQLGNGSIGVTSGPVLVPTKLP